ncbi:MAG: hypothetical protein LR006_04450 [Dehalococcoidia bacterium]|nr:hypothetical protein [Dehalococcoidia bacterium]
MEQVYEYIEASWLDAIDDLKRLLSQPSISAQGTGIQEAAALTAGLLQEYGMPSRILPTPGGPPVVYGELEGGFAIHPSFLQPLRRPAPGAVGAMEHPSL